MKYHLRKIVDDFCYGESLSPRFDRLLSDALRAYNCPFSRESLRKYARRTIREDYIQTSISGKIVWVAAAGEGRLRVYNAEDFISWYKWQRIDDWLRRFDDKIIVAMSELIS